MGVGLTIQDALTSLLKLAEVDHLNAPGDIVTDDDKEAAYSVIEEVRNLVTSLENIEQPVYNYFAKDFVEIMIERIYAARKRFPDWTNFDKTQISTFLLELNSGQDDKFYYFADQVFKNMMLPVLDDYEYAIMKAKEYGYEIRGREPASVTLVFKIESIRNFNVIIPSGTLITTGDGNNVFETIESGTIEAGSNSVVLEAKNMTSTSNTFVGLAGVSNQAFTLSSEKVILSEISVSVSGTTWTRVYRSLALQDSDDTAYLIQHTANEGARILFGDGINGKIPEGSITVNYATGGGVVANSIHRNRINTIVGTIYDSDSETVNDITVYNRISPAGGTNRETIEELRKNIAIHVSTTERSITRVDFEKNAMAVPGVLRAFAVDKPYIDFKGLNINVETNEVFLYIVPDSLGDLTDALEEDIRDMFDNQRKTFGSVDLKIVPAVYQDWTTGGNIYFEDGSNHISTLSLIKSALLSYFSFDSKDGVGDYIVDWGSEMNEIALSKIIAVVERFQSLGVRKVIVSDPVSDLTLEDIKIPRLISVEDFVAVDKDGILL